MRRLHYGFPCRTLRVHYGFPCRPTVPIRSDPTAFSSHLFYPLQEMSQLGGRSACYDAAAVMEALVTAPEGDIANGTCANIMAAGGPALMVKVGGGRCGS